MSVGSPRHQLDRMAFGVEGGDGRKLFTEPLAGGGAGIGPCLEERLHLVEAYGLGDELRLPPQGVGPPPFAEAQLPPEGQRAQQE